MLRAAIERRGRDPQDVADRLSLLGRFGDPSEIAKAALWLCSDESSFTVGHALAVDGGYLALSSLLSVGIASQRPILGQNGSYHCSSG